MKKTEVLLDPSRKCRFYDEFKTALLEQIAAGAETVASAAKQHVSTGCLFNATEYALKTEAWKKRSLLFNGAESNPVVEADEVESEVSGSNQNTNNKKRQRRS